MKNLSEYRFRASSVGKLMKGAKPNLTDNQKDTLKGLLDKKDNGKITDKQLTTLGDLIKKRDAKPKLSAGAKSYLDSIIQEEVFGRSHEIKSKYLSKGIMVEELSISLYQQFKPDLMFLKNEKRFNNHIITGEPDNKQGIIRDFKSSWDFSTFPLNATEIPNEDYKWQLDCYMELVNLKESELIYCLIDTPMSLIDDELRRLSWKVGALTTDSLPQELIVETVSNLIYTYKGLEEYCHQSSDIKLSWFADTFKEIDKAHRIKVFNHNYDYNRIKLMYEYLELARTYLIDNTIGLAESISNAT